MKFREDTIIFTSGTSKHIGLELLVFNQAPPQEADRGMLTRYGGYRKYSGADQNQYCCLAVSRGIYKG